MSGKAIASVVEKANAKYYVGQFGIDDFKMSDLDEGGREYVVVWDKYASVTSFKAEDVDLTAKYTYKKD